MYCVQSRSEACNGWLLLKVRLCYLFSVITGVGARKVASIQGETLEPRIMLADKLKLKLAILNHTMGGTTGNFACRAMSMPTASFQ
jgi:hypothetical protein